MGERTADNASKSSNSINLADIAERLVECLPVAIVVFDRRLEVIHRNQAAEYLFGSGDQMTDLLERGSVESQYVEWSAQLREVLDSAAPQHIETVLYHPTDEEEKLLTLTCVPLENDGGEVIGGILVAEDVSTRSSLEKRLAVSERLAAVGKMAARVAHELNNPLDGIMRYVNLAQRLLERTDQHKVKEYLTESRKGLMRMAQIISELLEFSRSTHTPFEEGNINNVLEEAVRAMSERAAESRVNVVCSFSEERMPSLRGSNLIHVACNLIKNAIDAMPKGGVLTISTRETDREVVITFEDTGTGLPEESDRVFEPFFTTKQPGQGTGLGLAICKDMIEKYHGTIAAHNRRGEGAVFTIRIPKESCLPPSPPRPVPGGATGKAGAT